ncbi:MAG: DNA-directed RNA polymerase subunit L [Methanocellales archaeon]
MEIKVLSKSEREIEIEIGGEGHTFLNLMKSALLQDKRVEAATYDIEHPLISDPILYLRTDGSDPFEVLRDAASQIGKQCDELKKKFLSAVRKA